MVAGAKLDRYENTLVFIDEIQHYPQFLTMLKFLREEHRYRFISSGSLLGIALKETVSVPIGSIIPKKMYQLDFEEFEYLINSSISIASNAISNPKYPLTESQQKNLLKLYMNDVGLLSSQLYQYNVQPILNDISGINLGSVYESAVAQELKAHYNKLFYYDNKQKGEVDFLVDDSSTMSILPIEVKSGKDYTVHSALDNLMAVPDYHINSAVVFSNKREIKTKGNIHYLPIYYVMFMENKIPEKEDLYF